MCKQLELSYIGTNGEVKLPLENWQYAVIAQVLGLSIREDGPCGNRMLSEGICHATRAENGHFGAIHRSKSMILTFCGY